MEIHQVQGVPCPLCAWAGGSKLVLALCCTSTAAGGTRWWWDEVVMGPGAGGMAC